MLVTLDLDGTLEDSRADMVAAVHRVRAAFRLDPRLDEVVRPWMHRGMGNLYAHCFDDLASEQREAVKQAYEEDYLAHVADSTRLYDGIEDALAELAELATLAVVTNKPEHISRALLDTLGIGHRFATVVGGDSATGAKPDPVMLHTAAERLDLGGVGLHVGDSAGDIKMAHAAGVPAVWCAWGYARSPGDVRPEAVAGAPGELGKVIREVLDV